MWCLPTLSLKCPCSVWNLFIGMLVLLIVAVALFYVLYLPRNSNGTRELDDPLSSQVAGVSWWVITHYLFYAVIGYFFPHCDLLALSVGFAWEGIEYVLGEVMMNWTNSPTDQKKWMTWSAMDIVANIAGFYTGKLIALI